MSRNANHDNAKLNLLEPQPGKQMFGIFKKKPQPPVIQRVSTKDDHFDEELILFGNRFSEIIRYIDPNSEQEMLKRARDDYYTRAESLAGLGAADLYMHEFAHSIFGLMDESELHPRHALQFYAMVDGFLDKYPYRTSYVTHIMNLWYERLLKLGMVSA